MAGERSRAKVIIGGTVVVALALMMATTMTISEIGSAEMGNMPGEEEPSNPMVFGVLLESDSDPAVNDTVSISNEIQDQLLPPVVTTKTGHFSAKLENNVEYDIRYYQTHPNFFIGIPGELPASETPFARDGSVDMYALAGTDNPPIDLGTVNLPEGHVVNVTVVDESGAPVENTSVNFGHQSSSGVADVGLTFPNGTNADGMFEIDHQDVPPGLELTGKVTIEVSPPDDDSRFVDKSYHRELTVSDATNVEITLEEL